MTNYMDFIIRIGVAFLAGALIGIERQYRQSNAGLRTNILVSVGAAAFAILSFSMTFGTGDPTRVAAQIVSGIGFIGGGLILKDGVSVRGLNTAATIWCSAACGALAGIGMFAETFIMVSVILITHFVFQPLCRIIEKRTLKQYKYELRVECVADVSENVRKTITNTLAFDGNVKLESLYYKNDEGINGVECLFEARGDHKVLVDLLVSRIHNLSGVSKVGCSRQVFTRGDY